MKTVTVSDRRYYPKARGKKCRLYKDYEPNLNSFVRPLIISHTFVTHVVTLLRHQGVPTGDSGTCDSESAFQPAADLSMCVHPVHSTHSTCNHCADTQLSCKCNLQL